ncbi:MAG: FlgD immunoglobulin-like domain containing protein, partial [bacterium]
EYTGFYFEGVRSGVAGGLAFSCEWDTTHAILFELCQRMPDFVVAYDLGPIARTLSAAVDIKPEVLNLKSRGRWVTSYIELPEGYSPEEIDRPTVITAKIDEQVLNPPIRTEGPSNIGDYDGDSIPDLMVKFSRQELIRHLQGKYGVVTILVSGELHNGTEFEGSDTLKVIEPPKSNRGTMVEGNRSTYTFQLCQNRPSPFLTSTRISYQIPQELQVTLTVYDVRGRLVRTLVTETQSAGLYQIEWQGEDDCGQPVPAGVYLCRLHAGPWSAARKTVFLR